MKNFNDFYHFLSDSQRIVFRDVTFIRMGWVRSTFYYKLNHGNFTILETNELAKIMEDFLSQFDDYKQSVISFVEAGGQLDRCRTPRTHVKNPNKLIDRIYEVSKN